MKKHIVHTVQIIKRTYYVEVDDVEWAFDGITMGELDQFSSTFFSEDIIDSKEVAEFPIAEVREDVNAAVMTFNKTTDGWDSSARWDLA